MKRVFALVIIIICIIAFNGCKKQDNSLKLLNENIDIDSINKVQIALSMGNPKYGARTKTFTMKDEIAKLIEVFNTAIIKGEVEEEDVVDADISNYLFYSNDNVVCRINFNGNDSTRVWISSKLYHVEYTDTTPFQIYNESEINEVITDWKTKDSLN